MGTSFLLATFSHFEQVHGRVLPTVELLDEIRPWLPAVMSGNPTGWDSRTTENARVYAALERRMRIRVVDETRWRMCSSSSNRKRSERTAPSCRFN